MKKILFSAWMVALVALAGCQQNDELTGVDKKVSLTADIKGSTQSRVAMEFVTGVDGDSKIKVDWKDSGESFKLYDDNDDTVQPTIFNQTSGNKFEGVLPSESGSYKAVYGGPNLNDQDGTLNEDYVWMEAFVNDLTNTIEFEHKTAVLKPTLLLNGNVVNANISEIQMEGAWDFNDNPIITITPQESDIFIFIPADAPYEENYTFYFMVSLGDAEYRAELTISQNIEAGLFYTARITLREIEPEV